MFRPRFDPRIHVGRPMVAASEFRYDGVEYAPGDSFPIKGLHRSKVSAMYGARRINFADGDLTPQEPAAPPVPASPVTVEAQPGGYYLISYPWADEPERVRGKAATEARQAEIEAEGPPLGFIAGGTQTTIEENGGGWYDVSAPWLDEPIKAQGIESAQAEQLALHEAGPPADWSPPEPPKAGDVVIYRAALEGDPHEGLRATVESIEGDDATIKGFEGEGDDAVLVELTVPLATLSLAPLLALDPYSASVIVSIEGDKFVLTAPVLEEPETFDTAEEAEARQAEILGDGPPDGWEAPTEQPEAGEQTDQTGAESTGAPAAPADGDNKQEN